MGGFFTFTPCLFWLYCLVAYYYILIMLYSDYYKLLTAFNGLYMAYILIGVICVYSTYIIII